MSISSLREHGQPEVIRFGQADWTGFANVKGGSKGGGGTGDGGTTGYIALPYTAGMEDAGGTDHYNIRIEFKGTWEAQYYEAFTKAADFLCRLIQDGLPDVSVWSRNTVTRVDDITISAELKFIDGQGGVLGQAGPTALRTSNYLPATASMQFDIADAATYFGKGLWDDIILHEMMHSLGFGSIWSKLGLVSNNYLYLGANANSVVDAYDFLPVESSGGSGTAGSHWSETALTSELMTGYINGTNRLNAISIASLADLGYGLADDAMTLTSSSIDLYHPWWTA
jgi:hypothetical protein